MINSLAAADVFLGEWEWEGGVGRENGVGGGYSVNKTGREFFFKQVVPAIFYFCFFCSSFSTVF